MSPEGLALMGPAEGAPPRDNYARGVHDALRVLSAFARAAAPHGATGRELDTLGMELLDLVARSGGR